MKNFSDKMLGLNLDFLNPIIETLNYLLIPVIALLATAGTIYSIILAVNMAKSDSAEKRATAKKKIIGVIITVISVCVLLFLLSYVLTNLDRWVNG